MSLARSSLLLGVALLFAVGCYLCDPLNRFELSENYWRWSDPLWANGLSCYVQAPATASLEDVLQKYGEVDRAKEFKVFESKRVWLIGNNAPTWAARVEVDSQRESLLLHYDPSRGCWVVK